MKSITFILLFLLIVTTSHGFLLAGTNSSNANKGFLTISEYYGDKTKTQHELKDIRQDLLRYRDEQEQTTERNLNLLANQLQEKLNEIDKKLTEKKSIPSNIADLEKKYEEMSKKYDEMKNSSEMWQQKYAELENGHNQTTSQLFGRLANLENDNTKLKKDNADMLKELGQVKTDNNFLENKTVDLQQRIDGLEQLKSVNQLQTLHQVDKKSKELETRINSLENTQQARSQDFMALFRKVTSLEMNEQKLETNMKGNFTSLENDVNSNFTAMQQHLNTTINGLERRTSTELDAMRASNNQSLSLLEQQMQDQFKPVIFRATHLNDETTSVLKFPNIDTTAGIPNSTITKYKSTGKFTCHDPGFYYVILTTEAVTTGAIIDIMVNSTSKFQQHMTGEASNWWEPGATASNLSYYWGICIPRFINLGPIVL